MRQLFRDTPEVSAEKVIVQHFSPVGRLPMDLF